MTEDQFARLAKRCEIPAAVPLFAEILQSDDVDERRYALAGLRALDTRAARTILYEHGES